MTKFAIALAAVVIAAMPLRAPPADAGVRIGFGFPLGHFTARPSHRHSYYRSRRGHAAGNYDRRRHAAAASRARHARAARIRQFQMAQRERAIARANARSAVKSEAPRDSVVKVKSKDENPAPFETTAEPRPLAPAPLAAPLATEVEPALEQSKATVDKQDPPVTDAPANASGTAPEAATGDCRKFVPAVGLTITVPCN